MTDAATPPPLYYILDARCVVGNCCSWWRPCGNGYACNLDDAGLFTEEEIKGKRETDVAVPQAVAERLAVRHVRIEHLQSHPAIGESVLRGQKAAQS